jgi:hypothetical protein
MDYTFIEHCHIASCRPIIYGHKHSLLVSYFILVHRSYLESLGPDRKYGTKVIDASITGGPHDS